MTEPKDQTRSADELIESGELQPIPTPEELADIRERRTAAPAAPPPREG